MNITRLSCPAAALALTACAASHSTPPLQASLTDRAPAPATSAVPFDGDVAEVIEIVPKPAADPVPVCRETKVTGTHIRRMVCEEPLSPVEAQMAEELFRSDLEHARELALRDEQERAERLLFDRMPQHVTDRISRGR